ncbi:MAG: DAK2 domain-containing protein [Chloroflexota bacterium]|nr:DAK2 domain-containing protein [Chloroflexota bacterium]
MVRARSTSPRKQPAGGSPIDGAGLRRALAGAAAALRAQADALNAINVFPIPDGDTGTNMSQTMRAAMDEVDRAAGDGLATIAKALAQGALMGAKGNSGVILSQILGGFAALEMTADALDAAGLADALERGQTAAYKVVSQPQEGTILTAISAAASGARESAAAGGGTEAALSTAVDGAREAVARTPELLPVLKEAGVVDAGAQGLYVLLDGMLRGLRGEATAPLSDALGAIDASWLSATEQTHGDGAHSGFCTEFVIHGAALDPDEIRRFLSSLGESLLVVGGDEVVRVHVHTQTPEDALAYARTLGSLSHEKVDDMEAQFQALAARTHAAPKQHVAGVAVVSIAAGDGIEELMRSLGASAIVRGGQSMNPSAGEIRAAIEATGASDVIVLPNNKNILLAAEQAASGLAGVRVLQSQSIPQGIAALIALNPEETLDENAAHMQEAIGHVRSGEVTLAARATTIGGVQVREGQSIGIIDGDLLVAEGTVTDAVCACVERMVHGCDATLITLYAGVDEDEAAASALAATLRARFNAEVEVVDGGQPHYPYLIGVE